MHYKLGFLFFIQVGMAIAQPYTDAAKDFDINGSSFENSSYSGGSPVDGLNGILEGLAIIDNISKTYKRLEAAKLKAKQFELAQIYLREKRQPYFDQSERIIMYLKKRNLMDHPQFILSDLYPRIMGVPFPFGSSRDTFYENWRRLSIESKKSTLFKNPDSKYLYNYYSQNSRTDFWVNWFVQWNEKLLKSYNLKKSNSIRNA